MLTPKSSASSLRRHCRLRTRSVISRTSSIANLLSHSVDPSCGRVSPCSIGPPSLVDHIAAYCLTAFPAIDASDCSKSVLSHEWRIDLIAYPSLDSTRRHSPASRPPDARKHPLSDISILPYPVRSGLQRAVCRIHGPVHQPTFVLHLCEQSISIQPSTACLLLALPI